VISSPAAAALVRKGGVTMMASHSSLLLGELRPLTALDIPVHTVTVTLFLHTKSASCFLAAAKKLCEKFVIFRVRHSRGKMYILVTPVCVSVCS